MGNSLNSRIIKQIDELIDLTCVRLSGLSNQIQSNCDEINFENVHSLFGQALDELRDSVEDLIRNDQENKYLDLMSEFQFWISSELYLLKRKDIQHDPNVLPKLESSFKTLQFYKQKINSLINR